MLELRSHQGKAASASNPVARRVESTGPALSFAQEGLWFLDKLCGPSGLYNVARALRMHGSLDLERLERCVQALVSRHESLRTAFVQRDTEVVQTVFTDDDTRAITRIEKQEVDAGTVAERELAIQAWLQANMREPFDISQGRLFRTHVLRVNDTEHILLLVLHHIVADGWSVGVLLDELSALYATGGKASALQPLPVQYADFAMWQRERVLSERLRLQLQYWRKQLDGLSTLDMPVDRPRPVLASYRGAVVRFAIPGPILVQLKALAQSESATPFMVLLAAFQLLLMRYTNQDDVAVGVPVAGRNRRELEGLIGYFVNSVVLRSSLAGNPSFNELLRRVRQTALDAFANQEFPFDRLVAELQPERDLGRNPLYQVSFALQNQSPGELEMEGVRVESIELTTASAKFDLSLALTPMGNAMEGVLEYSTDLFDEATIRRMSGNFQTLVAGIVADPSQSIMQLPLLSEAERHQQLVQWNDTAVGRPTDLCLHELFQAQVARTPDAVAVEFLGQRLSYRELDVRANRLANHLISLGVHPDDRVIVCMERGFDMVVAIMGTLKAGGAYVPVDPTYPVERQRYILDDSAPVVILTQAQIVDAWPENKTPVIAMDRDSSAIARCSDQAPDRASIGLNPGHLAYVIYTSGSTGEPKGVQIEHRAICNHMMWVAGALKLNADDRLLQKTSISFDASVCELFPPLDVGACLVLARPGGERDPAYLAEELRMSAITVIQLVPTALATLLDAGTFDAGKSLRCVVCGGEALEVQRAQALADVLPRVEIHNFYGPTEASIDVTSYKFQSGAKTPDSVAGTVPIGKPIDNMRIYVLDQMQQIVPVGVIGEIWIGGVGLARGYLNKPELTVERFIADPFYVGQRMYRTGDLGRWLAGGVVECRGRNDIQVKIRGFRIELGEIEAQLASHEKVAFAAVVAREFASGDKRLVAYIVSADNAPTDQDLRDHLRRRLPEFMVPQHFVALNRMPLLPNGKINRKGLPAITDSHRGDVSQRAIPRDDVERALCAIWQDVLGIDSVGLDENFFDLGGHSLKAMRLLARINHECGTATHVSRLFGAPTIRQLAAVIRTEVESAIVVRTQTEESCLVGVQTQGARPPIFLVPGAGGEMFSLHHLSRVLGVDQPLYSLDLYQFGITEAERDGLSVEDIARRMIISVRQVQAKGPYRIVGFSLGGQIAYEVAQQLSRSKDVVALIALLDCLAPGSDGLHSVPKRIWLHLKHAYALGPMGAARYVVFRLLNLRKYVWRSEPLKQVSEFDPFKNESEPLELPATKVNAMRLSINALIRAGNRYVAERYSGRVLLIRAIPHRTKSSDGIEVDPNMGWRHFALGGIDVEILHCEHGDMLKSANAESLGQVLAKYLVTNFLPSPP